MNLMQAMRERHSVRKYTDRRIEGEILRDLREEIEACNAESGLNMQLITDEPGAFGSMIVTYGMLKNVKNYIAIVGKDDDALAEKAGYFGERVVLHAQALGLNTCWVGLTFIKKRSRHVVGAGEKLVCVIAVGYGATQGRPHKDKPMEKLCRVQGEMPDWFHRGMEAAMLAPTAVNQQKFRFTLMDDGVLAESTGGPYSKVDLGIVKYHFELGAGRENFRWL